MPPIAFSPARTPHITGTPEGLVPFIGRRAILRAAGLRLEAGRGTVLLGPPGIGKSRTLRAVADAAERNGMRVARLVASRSSGSVPFGAFLALLTAPALEEAQRQDALGRATTVRSAVLALELGLVVVDDAHLLDEQSAALLHDLAESGIVTALVLDPAADAPDVLHSIPETSRAESVELPPFTQDESAQFLEAVLQGVLDGGSALLLHEAAGGVPLTLRELVEHQLRIGAIDRTGDLLSVRGPVVAPVPVGAQVRHELAQLDDATRSWVELVAIAEHVPPDLGPALVDDRAADHAESLGWIRMDDEDGYRVGQPLHRRPIVDSVGSRARRNTLRAVVDAVAALERPLTERERLLRGRWRLELGDELQQDEALELAASTPPSDPDLAERFLRVAAGGGGTVPLIALAQHLVATGRIEEAERLLWRAETADGADPRVTALLALATGVGGRRSAEALADVDRMLLEHPDSTDLLGVRIALLQAEARSGEAAAQAESIARMPGAGAGTVLGEVYGAVAMAERDDREAASRMAVQLRPLAEQYVRSLPEGPMLQAWLEGAVPWIATRDPKAVVGIAQAGYDQTLREGLRPDRARFAHLLAAGRLMQGDAMLAVRLLREAEAIPCFWRDSRHPEIVANLVEALVLAGDMDEAVRTLERLGELRRAPEHDLPHQLATAAVRMAQGDLDGGAAIATAAGDLAAARGDRAAAADAWTAALRYGSVEAARRLHEQPDVPADSVRSVVRTHAQAVLAHDAVMLTEAAEAYWRSDARLLAVEAVAQAARWSIESADTVQASAATERLLRWTVVTPGLSDPLADALPLAGLTSREQEIVRLAASGLTDKEVAVELGISARTAQTHLGRAFNKLGVHRRQQLTRLLPSP